MLLRCLRRIAMAENKKRIIILDELRGFAIICMIIHHAFLDVGDVLGLEWGYKVFNALCTVQPIFWAIFIIISGICSRLSRNTAKRGALGLCLGDNGGHRNHNASFQLCGSRNILRHTPLPWYLYDNYGNLNAFNQENQLQNRYGSMCSNIFDNLRR